MKKLIAIILLSALALLLLAACDDTPGEENLSKSGILYDFTFKLEGDTITLPLTLGDFMSLGWELSEYTSLPEILEGHTRLLGATYYKNGKEIYVPTINISEDEMPIQDALVYEITSSVDRDNYAVIELPKGIKLGVSTKKDVIAAFGWPTRMGVWEDYNEEYLVYEKENFGISTGIWGPNANMVEIITSGDRDDVIIEIKIETIS